MTNEDNKRIAKNTIFLYLRMFFSIIVNLYTVRVIWQVLGVDDYGVYNVVGGIVMMFSFLNSAMVSSSQRFISFELGKGNKERLNRVFCLSVSVHFMMAILVLLLAETVGLWFLNDKLNIPPDRMYAAQWVYQCSILAFLVTIISVPYNACIVAHEHMKVFGYFGILEVFLKLIIVLLLVIIPFDKLITYSILVLAVSILMRVIYQIYCKRHFSECRFRKVNDTGLMKSMFSFAGWSFIGNIGFSVRDQGLNIVVNMFFNVAVNAAKGIAGQIGNVVNGFSQSFLMALNPQITKRYASGEIDSMLVLVYKGCKFSAILMMFIVVPLFFASPYVLNLWLGDVAPYTVGFLKLTLIMIFIDSMVGPITTSLQATGRIKWFQIIISIIMLSNIPMAWIFLNFYKTPFMVLYVAIATSVIALITRLILLQHEISLSFRVFGIKVIFRIVPTLIISAPIAWILYTLLVNSFIGLVCYSFVVVTVVFLSVYFTALERNEKTMILNSIKSRFNR